MWLAAGSLGTGRWSVGRTWTGNRKLVGSVTVPRARMGPGVPPPPDVAGRAIAKALVPSLARQIEPELPAASPSRKSLERDASGQITGIVEVPATPSPAIRAADIASQIAARLAVVYGDSTRRAYVAFAENLKSSRP